MRQKPFTYLSICSGIEAATVAWHGLGWQAAGFAEIDPFARAVLAHHYPQVPLHGDFTALKESDYGAIDLLVGGTPCQSFSVAGLRKGFNDDRGNLTLEFIRLAQKAKPRWLVWENVPGVLSIDGGRTFGTFLAGLAECGYGFAYRILDAQYFGVPQRRRRVFVIGYSEDWRPAAAVLFERESLRGDITPRRKTRQSVAALTASGVGTCGADDNQGLAGHLIAHTLRAEGFDASEDGTGRGIPLVTFDRQSSGEYGNSPVASTVSARDFKSASDLVAIPINTQLATRHEALGESTGMGIGENGDPAFTLQAERGHAVAFNVTFCDANGRRKDRPDGGFYVNETEQAKTVAAGGDISTYIAFAQNCRDEVRLFNGDGSLAGALPAQPGMKQQTFVAMEPANGCFKPGQSMKSFSIGYSNEITPALEAGGGGNSIPALHQHMAVRRLTPRECERLQGFPDDYTLIPFRGKPAADGNRYKALGNSMAVPVMRWLGERIQKIEGMINEK